MAALTFDHVAFPCFDVRATHRFYTEALGCTLIQAQRGPAIAWDAEEYLLLAYGLPDGSAIDFFTFDGIQRPPDDGLPKDIHHLALAVPTRGDVVAMRDRFAAASIAHWTEVHDEDDLHVYVTDPNGVVVEIVSAEDGVRARAHDPDAATGILDGWLREKG